MSGDPAVDQAISDITSHAARREELRKQLELATEQLEKDKSILCRWMLEKGVPYISASPNNMGPFWTLEKKSSNGAWSEERRMIFFGMLLPEVHRGNIVNPDQCCKALRDFMSADGKRDVTLKPLKHCIPNREAYFKDIVAFIQGSPTM